MAKTNRGGVVVAASLLFGGCSSRPGATAAPAGTGAGSTTVTAATSSGSSTAAGTGDGGASTTGSGGSAAGSGGGTGGGSSSAGSTTAGSTTAGSTAAGSTSASSGSAGSSTSSGGGGGGTTAACNGACGQAGCEAYTCADSAPQGWLGPFQLYSGPPGQAPACAAPASTGVLSAFQDVQVQTAQCSPCTATNPHDFFCFAEIAAHTDATCSTMGAASVFFGQGFCSAYTTTGYGSAIGYEPPRASYVCDTPMQTPTRSPAVWSTAGVGCAEPSPAANGCASGQLCVPVPQAPFGARQCISKKDDTPCPSGRYTARSLFYTGTLDSRSCSACGYDPSPIACTGTSVLYTDAACSTQLEVVSDFSGGCMSLPGSFGSSTLTNAAFTGTPSCSPAGGEPIGALSPTGPVTVCCTP